jgi:hypothetical protein
MSCVSGSLAAGTTALALTRSLSFSLRELNHSLLLSWADGPLLTPLWGYAAVRFEALFLAVLSLARVGFLTASFFAVRFFACLGANTF